MHDGRSAGQPTATKAKKPVGFEGVCAGRAGALLNVVEQRPQGLCPLALKCPFRRIPARVAESSKRPVPVPTRLQSAPRLSTAQYQVGLVLGRLCLLQVHQ